MTSRRHAGSSARNTFNPSFHSPAASAQPKPPKSSSGGIPDRLNAAKDRARDFKVGDAVQPDNRWPATILEVDKEKGMLKLAFEPYSNSLALNVQKTQSQSPQWVSALMVDHHPSRNAVPSS